MKSKKLVFFLLSMLLLAACGQKTLSEPITLHNQAQKEITFPLEKPTVFFFITSYTWGLCHQQLVQLHENIDKLAGMDVEMYVLSKDLPEEQLQLYKELEGIYGKSLSFVSDPDLELIDFMGMKNGDVAYRGYGMLDQDGCCESATISCCAWGWVKYSSIRTTAPSPSSIALMSSAMEW